MPSGFEGKDEGGRMKFENKADRYSLTAVFTATLASIHHSIHRSPSDWFALPVSHV